MRDLFFFIRVMVMTTIFVFFLQIRIGEQTLEQQALSLIRTSSTVVPLQRVADGGSRLLRDIWSAVTHRMNSSVGYIFNSENRPGERRLNFDWLKTKEYVKEKADRGGEFVAKKVSDAEAWATDQERVSRLRRELREAGISIQPSEDEDKK